MSKKITNQTMPASTVSKKIPHFYSSIKSDIKVFANIGCILDKIEQDGNLALLSNTFQQIMDKEFVYAVFGLLNRAEEDEKQHALSGFAESTDHELVYIQGEL